MDPIYDYIQTATERQRRFFAGEGNLLFFTEYCSAATCDPTRITPVPSQIPSQTFPYSNWPYDKEFIGSHAYDLGIQYTQMASASAQYHAQIGDDWVPYIWVTWGTGGDAALLTGGEHDVVFHEGYSTFKEPVIKDWSDLTNLTLDLDNFWIRSMREFWRGVESAYELEGVTVSPAQLRTPLDFAHELRGNDLFTDFYDHPDEVNALLDFCTDSIIQVYRHLQDEFSILKTAPGGTWGVVFGRDTLWLNGDPVDLISNPLAKKFFIPSIEKLVAEIGGILLHHHSIGYKKAPLLSQISNLPLQEIAQDPNGPRVLDHIDEAMISASLQTPIKLDANILEVEAIDDLMARLAEGRFIIYLGIGEQGWYASENILKYRELLKSLRKFATW
jgi:hypothetical protein